MFGDCALFWLPTSESEKNVWATVMIAFLSYYHGLCQDPTYTPWPVSSADASEKVWVGQACMEDMYKTVDRVPLVCPGAVWSTPSCMFLQTVARLMSRRSPINLSVTQTSLSTRCWTFSALFLFRAFDSPPTIWITSKVLKPLPESFKQFEATLMRWNLASVNNYKHFSCFCNWFSQI